MIEALPSADSIIVVWFKLLAFAGKQNNDGVFLMSNRIAYTDEMLASIFRRDVNVVRLALKVFEEYGMIEIVNNVICIPNWNKHQTLDAYEKKKERDRVYQQNRRAVQRALVQKSSDSSTTQSSYVAISDKDIEEDIEKDKENNILNVSDETKQPKKSKPVKHKYGEFQHVLLTDNEFENLANSFGIDLRDRAIKFLDEYIEEKGYKSKSHNLAIRRWVIEAVQKQTTRKEAVPSWLDKKKKPGFNTFPQNNYDFDELERDLLSNQDTSWKEEAEALQRELKEKY